MYVKWPLDREECNLYIINITASDGLFVCHATVEVTVVDTNDNSPICDQVRNKKGMFSFFNGQLQPQTWLTTIGNDSAGGLLNLFD